MTVQPRINDLAENNLRLDRRSVPSYGTSAEVESSKHVANRSQQLTQMLIGYWTSRAIYAAAKLQVADHLANGPLSAEELAEAVGVTARPLHRLLRTLASLGIFAQEPTGRFCLTPLAELLRADSPDSLRPCAIMLGEEQYRCWDDVLETVRTGEQAFDRLYGQPLFAYLGQHPERARIFDSAMTGFTAHATRAVLDAYDLSDVATLADVGGGLGANLAIILRRYPTMRGLLFDQPDVIERSKPVLMEAGVSGRCTVEGGDFFETAPRGADAYILSNILHDWDDAQAGRILGNLRRAMSDGGRLLIVENIMSASHGASFSKLIDLHMMVVAGGQERTEAEFRRLFADHGFRLTRVVPTADTVSVIEGVPG
jgi:hypothetical protein